MAPFPLAPHWPTAPEVVVNNLDPNRSGRRLNLVLFDLVGGGCSKFPNSLQFCLKKNDSKFWNFLYNILNLICEFKSFENLILSLFYPTTFGFTTHRVSHLLESRIEVDSKLYYSSSAYYVGLYLYPENVAPTPDLGS